ncbi:glycosyltransferase [Candidatus Woesearchaeota archaeon]|nr:glycosyltransferase [Candidatus Woesearchaeota archaeon]
MKQPDLSMIIPVYNEEKSIRPLYAQLRNVLYTLPHTSEIIFVDDGSKDDTAEFVQALNLRDKKVKLVQLRKRFGKATALTAGFREAQGKIIITMDGDLQDDPSEIPRFIDKIHQGYDLVSGWKYHRKDPLSKTVPSIIFNSLARAITGVRIHDFNCGYKAYTQQTARTLNIYGEMHRYIPAIAHRNGFKIGEIKVMHHPRKHGKSKYGTMRVFKGFIDLLTVAYLSTYMEKPLHLFGMVGGLIFSTGFAAGLYLTYLWWIEVTIWNRPLPIFATLLMIVGIQFIFTGFIGEMIVSLTRDKNKEVENKIKR